MNLSVTRQRGELVLAINDDLSTDNAGGFKVSITVLPPDLFIPHILK